jgi:translation initiation factor 2B subunit (eIF-2B alpha/beta/delta family)
VTVIADAAVGYVIEKVDLTIVGAEAGDVTTFDPLS